MGRTELGQSCSIQTREIGLRLVDWRSGITEQRIWSVFGFAVRDGIGVDFVADSTDRTGMDYSIHKLLVDDVGKR